MLVITLPTGGRVYVLTWRRGLQFDVQHHRTSGSFRGHLWSWDWRRPWRITRCI